MNGCIRNRRSAAWINKNRFYLNRVAGPFLSGKGKRGRSVHRTPDGFPFSHLVLGIKRLKDLQSAQWTGSGFQKFLHIGRRVDLHHFEIILEKFFRAFAAPF
jgi:hypothetical protein